MPVQNKDINYDVVVKSLRRREVSCLVPATTPLKRKLAEASTQNKDSEDISENKPQIEALQPPVESNENEQGGKRIGRKKVPCLDHTSPLKDELYESPPEHKANEDISKNKSPVEVIQPLVESLESNQSGKRFDRKQESPALPRVKSHISTAGVDNVVQIRPIPSKRVYRRRTVNISGIAKRWSKSDPDLQDDNALFTGSTQAMKSTYGGRKSVLDPTNTPIVINCESLGEANSVPIIIKRGRGRPPGRKSRPLPVFSTDEESTCSVISQESRTSSSGNRRPRKSMFQDLEEDCHEEEPVSEYEKLRQRNIEENFRMLRQLFMEQGLEFEEKSSSSSDTPKVKKPYTRLPLPPPRPKSARIVERQSYEPLDFTKLSQRLSLLN